MTNDEDYGVPSKAYSLAVLGTLAGASAYLAFVAVTLANAPHQARMSDVGNFLGYQPLEEIWNNRSEIASNDYAPEDGSHKITQTVTTYTGFGSPLYIQINSPESFAACEESASRFIQRRNTLRVECKFTDPAQDSRVTIVELGTGKKPLIMRSLSSKSLSL